MKKLIAGAAALLLLAGCGSSTPTQETKTCSLTYQGIPTTMKIDAEDNDVTVVEMNMEQDAGQDMSSITDDQKAQIKTVAFSGFGLTGEEKGLTTSIDFEGSTLKLMIKIDLKTADAATLKAFSLQSGLKFDTTVKELETSAGATCK